MATAADYAVNFGYKAQDGYYYGPNGKVGKYHRGNDRPCPTGTPIVISGVTIGLTGATGLVSGPHLHTQACTAGSNYANDVDPSPFEFKNGTVVGAGWHSQFGNNIVVRVGGVDITYAHLSKINVAVGQQIGTTEVANRDQVNNLYKGILFRAGDDGGLNNYTGRDANQIASEMLNSPERKNLEADIASARKKAEASDLIKGQLQATQSDLTVARTKLAEVTKALDIVQKENASLKSQAGDSTKWMTLKTLLKELLR